MPYSCEYDENGKVISIVRASTLSAIGKRSRPRTEKGLEGNFGIIEKLPREIEEMSTDQMLGKIRVDKVNDNGTLEVVLGERD